MRRVDFNMISSLKKYKLELLFILPLTLYIFGFTLLPIVKSILLGFQDNITGQWTLSVYQTIFKKPDFKGKGIIRSLVLMPMGIPTLVSGVTLLYVFGTRGYLNEFLYRLGLIHVPINWTSGDFVSLIVIAFADTWKVLPIVVLLLLAGLESISKEIYEASGMTELPNGRNSNMSRC